MMALLAWGCVANAQVWIQDSVSMGTGSTNDVFYSMVSGSAAAKVENNKNWHMAFSMNAGDSSAIWINHHAGNNFVKAWNIHRDSSQWNMVTLADTATGDALYNTDAGWYAGALNNKPGTSPYDFGWGKYDPITHNIIGDSIFIIRANGDYFKVWIKELQSTAMTYTFTIGHIVSAMDSTFVIAKQPKYANNLFAHFDMGTGADTNREPAMTAWDILFTRYSTNAPGSGPSPNNSVIGVLSNRGVKIAKANPVHPDTAYANFPTYIASWSPTISGIGYNWKTYDQPTNTWSVEDSTSYFVQDKAGNLWQLMFTNYSGSSSGNINFSKRIVAPVGVQELTSAIAQYSVFPVPTSHSLNLVLDVKTNASARVQLSDLNGRTLSSFTISLQSGLNAYQLPVQNLANGNYILNVQGQNIRLAQQITVAH